MEYLFQGKLDNTVHEITYDQIEERKNCFRIINAKKQKESKSRHPPIAQRISTTVGMILSRSIENACIAIQRLLASRPIIPMV